MKLEKTILIRAPIKKVYGAYADIQGWKNILEDVVRIDIDYDDGLHQEFDMTVQRQDNQETVHSIRFCYPYSAIEIFQTKPPPLFKSMSGIWKFVPQNGGVMVQATREFDIKNNMSFNPSVLETFLEKNLSSFKIWIESCA